MLSRTPFLTIATLTFALTLISAHASHAELAGSQPAQELVSGLSAQRTVQNEAKPLAAKASSSLAAASVSEMPKLDSRLELSAGSDHLLDSPGFIKQSSLFAEGRYRVNPWLQFGASGALRVQGDGNGTADLAAQLLVGPTFNLGIDAGLQNAFFISPKIGPTLARTVIGNGPAQFETRFAAELTLGKRFAIGKSLAFAPAIGAIWQSGFSPNVVIQPIALSLFI